MRLPALEISNPLAHLGEEVEFEVVTEAADSLRLVVRENYLQEASPREKELALTWEEPDAGGVRRGRASYVAPRTGSYLAELRGGAEPLPSRYFAVATPGMAVCNAFMNGAFFGAAPGAVWGEDAAGYYSRLYAEIVHPLHIPFDYHVGGRFRAESEPLFRPFAEFEYLYGDTIIPMATTVNFGYEGRFSLWELSEDETVAAIQDLKQLWAQWGFRPLEVLNIHWCMGNVTMRAARRCGIRVLAGLVPNYYMRDGESREIATGSPLRPYFMDHEDFRKAGRRTEDAILCLPFSVVIPTNFHRGNVDAHWATDIQMVWDRSIESGPMAYRSAEVLDMLCEQPRGEIPLIFPMGMQNFGPPAVYENNCNSLRYAIQKAREGRLVFANARALYDYYLRHFAEQPETVLYVRDFMVGSWLIDKPIHHPDVIQIENAHLHAAFNRGEALPDYLYDYDRPWDYPDEIFRDLTRFGPEPESLEGVEVSLSREETAEGGRVSVHIRSPRAFRRLPVAVWDLPYDLGARKTEVVSATPAPAESVRFVPVAAPLEGSQHALLLGPVVAGENTWVVELRCPRHSYTPHLRDYHHLLGLKTIPNPGRMPYTYLWTQLPGETVVRLSVPRDRVVWAEKYDGSLTLAQEGRLTVALAWPRPWARVWNVRADEVEGENGAELDLKAIACLAEILHRFALEQIGALIEFLGGARAELACGDLRVAGEERLARVLPTTRDYLNRYISAHWQKLVAQRRAWFQRMTAVREVKQVLVAAHAYIKGHLGGPWRDKADLADVIETVPGVEFSLPIYDYAIAWEPGHSAWHMGRAFTMRLRGLAAYQGKRVVLHLHGYDYDRLGRAYTVRFVAKEIAGGRPVEMHRAWLVPPGPEGRDHPESLLSLEIPAEYLTLEQFDVVILEGYLARAIDMRKQVPYSVAISDVWVTEE